MRVRKLSLSVSFSEDELSNIRNVIVAWGKSQAIADDFDGSKLHQLCDSWAEFVDTDWDGWDIAEYNHDLGVRYWLQLVLENAGSENSTSLHEALQPIDDRFIRAAHECDLLRSGDDSVFNEESYFWRNSSIHPEIGLPNEPNA
ncbi:hypothetical protein L4D06_06785 [Enterovibrio makurazakiensis]|uniref:hypothetical protein n=1 Tax=Enterovibrio makurazakiensis TaxID=2910232 RepID=UPI003D1A3EF4